MIVIPAARIEEMKAAGWWDDITFEGLLRRHVAERPDAGALVDPIDTPALVGRPARRLTWREVGDAVDRMAAVLTARGIGPDPAERAVLFAPADGGRMRGRLVDPDSGREIDETGRPGELRIKGPTVFSGYWRAPELNAAAFDDDGWFRTGDLFEFAGGDRRHLRLVGRLKDIVVRGGMKISSEEIERHLLAHPAVAEAAVVGKPDDRLGERLAAFVVFRLGMAATLAEPNAFLTGERRVAVYKRIEQLDAVDALPRNPIGKVLKRDLRRTYLKTENV